MPRHARAAILTALGGGGLFALLASGSIPCTFAALFHAPCPGCGSTRAVHALLHGDVGAALAANPLGPVVALLVGALGVLATISAWRDGSLEGLHATRAGRLLTRVLAVTVIVEILIWLARFGGALGGPVPV